MALPQPMYETRLGKASVGDARHLLSELEAETVDLVPYLPTTDDPMRGLALRELIKTDLEIGWRKGLHPLIENYVRRGLTEDEALKEPLDVAKDVDPYPIGQRLFPRDDWVTESNIRNVYQRVRARRAQSSSP